MASVIAFSPKVAFRTLVAQTILKNPDMLSAYENAGGLREDLETISIHGVEAEQANLGQSVAAGESKGATLATIEEFSNLREKYSGLMSVVVASKRDLINSGASKEIIKSVDQIIKNEVPVRFVTIEKNGEEKKKARKAQSYEAIRSEIHKDANAILVQPELVNALARRNVTPNQIVEIIASAEQLSGKLGEQTVKRGTAKAATQAERAAVQAQNAAWAASLRLLKVAAIRNAHIAQLLSEASRAK